MAVRVIPVAYYSTIVDPEYVTAVKVLDGLVVYGLPIHEFIFN